MCPQLDVRRILSALEAEECNLERAVAELRIVALDEAFDDHDHGDVAWNSEDAANVASDTLAREVGFGLIEEFQTAIEDVRQARQRLLEGRYGQCERCGATVAPARLDAVPATRWCVACASSVERQAQRRRLAAA